jgi:hypothetical protein
LANAVGLYRISAFNNYEDVQEGNGAYKGSARIDENNGSFMRRFFVEKIIEIDGMCLIPEKEARHITMVLRMKANDPFILINGKGEGFEAVIEKGIP